MFETSSDNNRGEICLIILFACWISDDSISIVFRYRFLSIYYTYADKAHSALSTFFVVVVFFSTSYSTCAHVIIILKYPAAILRSIAIGLVAATVTRGARKCARQLVDIVGAAVLHLNVTQIIAATS